MYKVWLFFLFLLSCHLSVAQNQIVPRPNYYEEKVGNFMVNKHTSIVVEDPSFLSQAHFLQKELLKTTGLTLSIQSSRSTPSIVFRKSKSGNERAEGYRLNVNPDEVTIISKSDEGAFYGLISLIQLIRAERFNKGSASINCLSIADSPKYSWRGILLDESRHFFGKETVKSILDWMAFYKLNRFHWHLTDAPGWRFEVKQYPRLNLVGGIGNHTDPYAPAAYYTQEDIKEIVAYAKERYITVVPEVDMPGHATAANRAYPEFSGGGSANYPEFTFNPGKEETYQYLTDILRETAVLFPSGMIHLGGDEVHFGNESWNNDKHVQLLMRDKKLRDLKSVEQYFIQRMADSLFKLNNKVLLWDEAADSSLPPNNTIVFWWRHDKPEQLKLAFEKGYSVVLTPRIPYYFDFIQHEKHRVGRKWKLGEFSPLEKVYNFSLDTLPKPHSSDLIMGVQGALWSEQILNDQKLQFMLFPRICSLAENAWTEDKNRNFGEFSKRLEPHLNLFGKEKIYFFNPHSPEEHAEPIVPGGKK